MERVKDFVLVGQGGLGVEPIRHSCWANKNLGMTCPGEFRMGACMASVRREALTTASMGLSSFFLI